MDTKPTFPFFFFSNGVIKEEQPESTCANSDMPLDRILEAQTKSEKAGENPSKTFITKLSYVFNYYLCRHNTYNMSLI